MSLTLENWIWLIVGGAIFFGIVVAIIFATEPIHTGRAIGIAAGVVVFSMIGVAMFVDWYNTSTASGIRNYKDYQSELSNGIEREIVITAEDGREIYHYKGKVDVESDHEDSYIKFEREDGGREIVYYGITDTVLITEVK